MVLQSLNLVGSISPYVGNLSFLRVLVLNNNKFHNNIPPEIGRLHRLQFLCLRNNTLEHHQWEYQTGNVRII